MDVDLGIADHVIDTATTTVFCRNLRTDGGPDGSPAELSVLVRHKYPPMVSEMQVAYVQSLLRLRSTPDSDRSSDGIVRSGRITSD